VLPSKLTRRTSFFGDRRIYKYTNGRSETSLHNGIDFGIPLNTPVCACGAGKVIMSEYRISTGWTIVIEHLPGLYSLYYHLNNISVETGTMVKAGDDIALSGNTGLSTGPHLHWEMRLLGEAVNPDFFIETFSIFLGD
jgi:murein DD-endopeptidase MepM/ murein hydrolase activator NlpD